MSIRTFLIMLAATAILQAQPRPGRGPGEGRGGPGPRFIGAAPGMPGRVVKNAPYSAEIVTETSQALADGNRIRKTNTSRIYRDSEGRTRREQTVDLKELASASNLPPLVFISDPVAGADYALNASDKTATKMIRPRPMGGQTSASGPNQQGSGRQMERRGGFVRGSGGAGVPVPRRSRNDDNVKTESLGRQSIEGVPADGTRVTMTIPAGQIGNENPIQIVTETWYSQELQTTVLSKRSDPRSGETVFRLANVSRAEPPRTMFDVPVDYKITEMSRGRGGAFRK